MAEEVVDLDGTQSEEGISGSIGGASSDVKEVPEIVTEVGSSEVSSDPSRLSSLFEEGVSTDVVEKASVESPSVMGAVDSDSQEIKAQESFGGVSNDLETPVSENETSTPEISESPLAPEEQELRTNSRIFHVLLSVVVIVLVVSGAALAAYLYSKSDSNFIKLPKLPFVKEPLSSVEMGEDVSQVEYPAQSELPETAGISPEVSEENSSALQNPVEPVMAENEQETTKGGLPLDTSGWKLFESRSWGFSFKYPTNWYLYPRDVGSLGEATVVAPNPLPSLESDLRQMNLTSRDLAIGFGVVSNDKPLSQTTLQFLKEKAVLYGISSPEEVTVARREFVRALTVQGGVMNYYISTDQLVYYISIKPADYASTYADQVETIVGGLTFTQ